MLLSASDCTIAGVTLLNIHSTVGTLHKLKSQLVSDALRMIVKPAFKFVNKIEHLLLQLNFMGCFVLIILWRPSVATPLYQTCEYLGLSSSVVRAP